MGGVLIGTTSGGGLGEDGVLGNRGAVQGEGVSVMKGSCSLSWATSKGGT